MGVPARAVGVLLLATAAVGGLVACGGGGGGDGGEATTTASTADQEIYFAQPSSVGSGTSATPPAIAAGVRRAATAAGCTVAAYPSEGRDHTDSATEYKTTPPTSGNHNVVWADFGVYDQPVPAEYLMHNLEHGAVVVTLGSGATDATRTAAEALWRESPAFMIVTPGSEGSGIPAAGLAAATWQRAVVCPAAGPKALAAVRAFRDAYRGTGPEGVSAVNAPPDATDSGDLPRPAIPDEVSGG